MALPRSLPLVVAASLALGCVTLTPPLTPPERGGAAWRELTSKHFVLDTDLEAAEADSTLSQFEGIFFSLASCSFAARLRYVAKIAASGSTTELRAALVFDSTFATP